MKRIVGIFLLGILSAFFLSGCSSSSAKTPEKLLTKPNYDEEKAILSSGITKVMFQNVTLIFPDNTKDVGKINYVDLDEDGVNEVVAFQKKDITGKDTEVGFMVLRENGESYNFLESGETLEKGKKIEYAGFYDIDSDGNKEIIMQFKDNNNLSKIGIYSLNGNEIKTEGMIEPEDASGKPNEKSLSIKIGYIDDDNIYDIVVLTYDSESKKMTVNLADMTDGELKIKDSVVYDNPRGLSETRVSIGNISKEKKGVVIDMPNDTDQGMMTSVLYVENDKFVKITSDDDPRMITSYYIPITDINNDNVIDIPCIVSSSTVDKSYAFIDYYQWSEDRGLSRINEIYYNYSYNFRVNVPKELYGLLSVEQNYINEDIIFTFRVYSDMGIPEDIFTLTAKPKTSKIDDNQSLNKEKATVIVMETEDYTYQVTINNAEILGQYNLNTKNIKEIFARAYE